MSGKITNNELDDDLQIGKLSDLSGVTSKTSVIGALNEHFANNGIHVTQQFQDTMNTLKTRMDSKVLGYDRQLANVEAYLDINSRASENTGSYYDLMNDDNPFSKGRIDLTKGATPTSVTTGTTTIELIMQRGSASDFKVGDEVTIYDDVYSEDITITSVTANYVKNPLVAPTLVAQTDPDTSTALAAATYYVKYTWVNDSGETLSSPTSSVAITAGQEIKVTVPTFPSNVSSINVYIGTTKGSETKQGSSISVDYYQSSALVAGASLPSSNTTNDSLGVSSLVNNYKAYAQVARSSSIYDTLDNKIKVGNWKSKSDKVASIQWFSSPNTDQRGAENPHIDVDSKGTVHLVYETNIKSGSLSGSDSGVWNVAYETIKDGVRKLHWLTKIGEGNTDSYWSQLYVDKQDVVHIVYNSEGLAGAERNIVYIRVEADGTINDPIYITKDYSNNSQRPAVHVDDNETVHIVFESYIYNSSVCNIGYVSITKGNFPGSIVWITTHTTSGYNSYRPSIHTEAGGKAHVTFECKNGNAYNIGYSTVTDNVASAITWITSSTTAGIDNRYPRTKMDLEGKIHLVYSSYDYNTSYPNAAYRTITNGTAGSIIWLTSSTTDSTWEPDVDVDDNGKVHACFYTYTSAGSQCDIGYVTLTGTTVSAIYYATAGNGRNSRDGRIRVNGKNIHLAFDSYILDGNAPHLGYMEFNKVNASNELTTEFTDMPLKKSIVRYDIDKSTNKVATWVERETGDLTVSGQVSMVGTSINESYQDMTKSTTQLSTTKEEDQFIGSVSDPQSKVTLKLTMTRIDATKEQGITRILGAVG